MGVLYTNLVLLTMDSTGALNRNNMSAAKSK